MELIGEDSFYLKVSSKAEHSRKSAKFCKHSVHLSVFPVDCMNVCRHYVELSSGVAKMCFMQYYKK